MKKLFFTLLASIVFISMYGQVPQEINYQGVARNSSGTLLSNQNIGIKLDLHQGSAGGTIVFSETHNKTTNVFGLFTLGIGSVNASGFTAINWANGPYFLEVSMDPAGGTSYSSVGTQQFMSVPYALYAQTAGNASATPTITINAPNTVTSAAGSYTINVPAAISYSAGTGIDITGGVISNTASATTPTIVGTGATTVTGTYPNLTINTPTVAADQTVSLVGTGTATVTGSYPNFTVNVPSGSNLPTGLNGQFLYHTGTIWDTLPRTNLYFDGTNIGIGTISPQANFHVVGAGRFDASVLTPHVFTNTLTVSGGTLGQVLTSDASGNGTFQNLPSVSSTSLTQGANVTVVGSSPSYTVSAPAYSISLPGGNVVQITNGVSTSTAPIAATNLTLGGANNNILSAGGNTVGLNTYTAGTGISISGTAPNYTLSSPNQSLTINSNSLSITGGNTVTIPTSTINGSGMGIATVTTSVNNFTVNVPSPTYTASSGVLSFGGTNTVVVTPTLSLTGTTLTSGPTTNSVNLSSLSVWSNSVGVLSPTILSNSVGIGTSGPISGKVEISHSATAVNPHLNFVSPSGAYGIMKYSNTSQTNYFSTEYINNGTGNSEAYSINQFNGTNSKPVFLINGQRMTYINALNFPLATFHVMTSTATANGGIASEGFAQGGQLNIVRNNNAGAGARTAIVFGDEIGKINFAGYDGTGYGDGAKIYAKATENVTGSNKGTELIFSAVPTGTNTSKEVFKINGANKLEVITDLLIPNNSGAGKVLTSDALGNASWQVLASPPVAPWIQGAGIITQTNLGDKVGIGTNTPNAALDIKNNAASLDGLALDINNVSNGSNGLQLRHFGIGNAAYIEVNNSSSNARAIEAITNSNGATIDASNSGTGSAGIFAINNASNTVSALTVNTNGTGSAIYATNNSSTTAAIYASNSGTYDGLMAYSSGGRAIYAQSNSTVGYSALEAIHYGMGTGIMVTKAASSTSGNVAIFNNAANLNSSDALVVTNSGVGNSIFASNSNTSTTSYAGSFDGGLIVKGKNTASADYALKVSSSSFEVFGIKNNGNVGINILNPANKLQVNSSFTNAAVFAENIVTGSFANAHGIFGKVSAANTNSLAAGVFGNNAGAGPSVFGIKTASDNGVAARFENLNTANTADGIFVSTNGGGAAIHAVNGPTVTGGSNVALWIEAGHIKTSGTIPAITTTLTTLQGYTIFGNDVAGKLSALTSTLTAVPPGQDVLQITFSKPYPAGSTPVVILTNTSPNSFAVQAYVTGVTNTGFKVRFNNASALNTSYSFNYLVIE